MEALKWIAVVIGGGFVTASIIIKLPPVQFLAPSSTTLGVGHILIWIATAFILDRLMSERRAVSEYGRGISGRIALLIKRFEDGHILKPTEIDDMIAYFRTRPDSLQVLQETKPEIAAAIDEFIHET